MDNLPPKSGIVLAKEPKSDLRTTRSSSEGLVGEATRIVIALAIPLLACGIQWMLWSAISPYVWFLFYPAIFFGSWVGGWKGGLAATILSAVLVMYFFMPPQVSFKITSLNSSFSIGVFVFMGVLLSIFNERLRRANQKTSDALETVRLANEGLRAANAEVNRLYEQIRQIDVLKTQFFAQVSHELRTPLTLILGPLARQLSRTGLPEEVRQDLAVVNRNAELLLRHVNDLLDVAKLDAGRMTMSYSRPDLAQLARFVASHFEGLAKERSIKLAIVSPETVVIQADAEKCQRIILNLLSNAFKFTPDKGAITLGLRREGAQLVLWVQDNGPGVPEALREAVFERFRQAGGERQTSHMGTGLGLAIVKEFIAMHRGTVGVSEAEGGGALFKLTLPVAAPANAVIFAQPDSLSGDAARQAASELSLRQMEAVPQRPETGLNAPLILVVEDNPEMLRFIMQALEHDYRIIIARDGEEGLAKAMSSKPALVVSDLMMPRMSGEQMLRAMRARPETAELPVFILTARVDDAARVALLQAGAQDCLYKPFLTGELVARVGNLIASRRLVEGAVLEGEQRYRSLFENMLDGYAYCRLLYDNGVPCDFLYVEVNPAFERLSGLKDVVGRKITEVIPGVLKTNPEILEVYSRVVASGRPERFEVYIERLNEWLSIAVYTPHPDHFVAMFDNITKRKKAEESLRNSEARLNLALKASKAGVWEWELISNKNFWSEELWQLYGLDVHDGEPSYDLWVGTVHPDDLPSAEKLLQEAIGRSADFSSEWRVRNSDRWLMSRGQPVRDAEGKVTHYIGIVLDVTERKNAEQEIRQLNAGLEQRVRERTAEWEAANKELESFSYSVSHDLRAPLRGIDGFSRALLESHGQALGSEGKAHLNRVLAAAQRMSTLIDDLLTLSRVTRADFIKESVDISALAREIALDLRQREPGRVVDLVIADQVVFSGDRRLLRAVMDNLIGNAWKFTSKKIDARIEISQETNAQGQRVCIVADNGAGFDMNYGHKLFGAFQRLHAMSEFPGTGIGLATVQRVINRHGGRVWAEGKVNEGARFCFTIPD